MPPRGREKLSLEAVSKLCDCRSLLIPFLLPFVTPFLPTQIHGLKSIALAPGYYRPGRRLLPKPDQGIDRYNDSTASFPSFSFPRKPAFRHLSPLLSRLLIFPPSRVCCYPSITVCHFTEERRMLPSHTLLSHISCASLNFLPLISPTPSGREGCRQSSNCSRCALRESLDEAEGNAGGEGRRILWRKEREGIKGSNPPLTCITTELTLGGTFSSSVFVSSFLPCHVPR